MAAHDVLVIAMFVAVLLTIVSIISLGWACPPHTEAYSELFRVGAVPPYPGMVSLRARYIVPWHPAPSFAGCRVLAPWSLVLARVGAVCSVIVLFVLVALEMRSAWI
jgi:hypothetical protein